MEIIGLIIKYLVVPVFLLSVITMISYSVKGKKKGLSSFILEHKIIFDNDITVKYIIEPPNFRKAFHDELGMRNSCRTCI